jgi:hypothetical protein
MSVTLAGRTGPMGEQTQMRAPRNYLRVDLCDPAEAEYWQVVLDAPQYTALASVRGLP